MVSLIKPSHIEILSEICDLCGICIAVCPQNVINFEHKRLYIEFDECTYCSMCIDICPIRAIEGIYS